MGVSNTSELSNRNCMWRFNVSLDTEYDIVDALRTSAEENRIHETLPSHFRCNQGRF